MLRPAVLIALTALTLIGSPLVAAAAPSLNWGSHVNPARCPTDQGYRYLEINVTRKVEGDLAFTYEQMVPGAALERHELGRTRVQPAYSGLANWRPGAPAHRRGRTVLRTRAVPGILHDPRPVKRNGA
jgi:hypothetical protein